MKNNYCTCLIGKKVVFVPYRPEHVPTYHQWMQDPYLLEMTASEPLSYQEEVEMQQEWKNDDNKCTFILLYKDDETSLEINPIHADSDASTATSNEIYHKSLHFNFITNTLQFMIGDINLFLSDVDDDDFHRVQCRKQAELDIMIAEKSYRGKGIGHESVCMMILYGSQALNIGRFFVKVNEDNNASLNLFRKLGFVQCNYVECFHEIELEMLVINEALESIKSKYSYNFITVHPDE